MHTYIRTYIRTFIFACVCMYVTIYYNLIVQSGVRPPRVGSRHVDRLFIVAASLRDLILRYTGRMALSNNKTRAAFTPSDLPVLLTRINQDAPFLFDWIQEIEGKMSAGPRRKAHLEFLAELSYNTSVDGGLFKRADRVRPVLQKLAQGLPVLVSDIKILDRYFPALARLLHNDATLVAGLPVFFHPVMQRLLDVGDNLRNVPPEECCSQPVSWRQVSPEGDLNIGYCYPPTFEQRESNTYTMQTRKSDLDSKAGGCRKASHRFLRVMPGVFAVFCPHGFCLGFHFMSNFESPETLFSLMIQRRRTLPQVCIYDNDCHGHSYTMNREPWLFRKTEFYIDRMHFWCGHIGCSVGFCIDRFSMFNCLNTEVAEQMFSILDRITTPVSYMNVPNATRYVRIFFALQNQSRKQYWSGVNLRSVSNAKLIERQQTLTAISNLLSVLAQDG